MYDLNPFEADFSTTMMKSGMFVMSSMCSFNITPQARLAKIADWHKEQVAEIDRLYTESRYCSLVIAC
jgi:hypothetical protein